MAYKYDNWNDRSIRSSFPATESVFKSKDLVDKNILVEVTDVRGDIVELRTKEGRYLHIPMNLLNLCIANYRTDSNK